MKQMQMQYMQLIQVYQHINLILTLSISLFCHLIYQACGAIERAKKAEHETWREKQASRLVIQSENKNILCELEDAQIKMEEAIKQASRNYKLQVESTLQHNNLIRSERQRFWETVQQTKEKGNIKLEKESQGYEAIISHMQNKHTKEVNRLKEGIKHNETLIATNELKHRAGE